MMRVKEIGYSIYALFISLFALFNVNIDVFMVLTALMFFDTILGVAKSWRMKTFTSHQLKVGVVAKALLLIIVFSLGMLSFVISHDSEFKDKFIIVFMGLICAGEVISMIQNYIVYKKGVDIQEYDAITNVLQRTLKFLRSFIERYMK